MSAFISLFYDSVSLIARYRLAEDRTRGFLCNRGAPGGDGLKRLSLEK